jgi:capsular exopolysaccharide synthesis family protein
VETHLGLPLLAQVPLLEGAPEARVLREAGDGSAYAESYRTLRAALDAHGGGGPRVVTLVSAAAGEGKTVVAVNLALALGARGDETVLVDGDLRDPRAHRLLAASGSPGVADVLAGRAASFEAVQALPGTRLRLLAAGSAPQAASDALRPDAVEALLASARERYRHVVVDTPPLAVVADALAFAGRADQVVLVVGAGVARRSDVQATLARLRAAGIAVAGVVLNRAATGLRFHQYGIPFRQWRGAGGAGEETDAAPLARTG